MLWDMGASELPAGSVIAGRFELRHVAGAGGMGTVYRALDRTSCTDVALKLLNKDDRRPDAVERFHREAQVLAGLRHPGIVAHVAHGQAQDGQPFLAMEWLDGQDLGQRLQSGPLLEQDCITLLNHVCDALQEAHGRGVLHRDLKPANLFLVDGDVRKVKLLDFGLVRWTANPKRLTKSGELLGTPEYMAPEQARGRRDLTPAVDLFSLGCILYECLCGQPAFAADHLTAVLVKILFEQPMHISRRGIPVSRALLALLDSLLAKNPIARVPDAAALKAALTSVVSQPGDADLHPEEILCLREGISRTCVVLASELDAEEHARLLLSDVPAWVEQRNALWLGKQEEDLPINTVCLANGVLALFLTLGEWDAVERVGYVATWALRIKDRWPGSQVAIATGESGFGFELESGEVSASLAALSLLENRTQLDPSLPAHGVWLDEPTARFISAMQPGFPLIRHPSGTMLLQQRPASMDPA